MTERKRSSVYLNKIKNLYFKIKFILVSIKPPKITKLAYFYKFQSVENDHGVKPFPKTEGTLQH